MIDFNFILNLVKEIFAFLGGLIYLIFALVVIKQVTSMSKNVYDKFNAILIAFSYLHFLFSAFLLVATLLLLLT
tara:strand:- start:433 stop:654 length:222 start_codon:yes stop_codon:yes gene_type:complete